MLSITQLRKTINQNSGEEMQTLMLRYPFIHTNHSPNLISAKPFPQPPKHHQLASAPFRTIASAQPKSCCTYTNKPSSLPIAKPKALLEQNISLDSESEKSKYVIIGAVSVSIMIFLMGMDDQKALALGPEGPLIEEFWDNVRRYGLYILTVSSGALYVIFQPIFELLKNPISAILVITILGGGFFIVSQVVSAMIGATDFDYQYYY